MFCLAERIKALGGEWGARARTDGSSGTIVWFHMRFPPPPRGTEPPEAPHVVGATESTMTDGRRLSAAMEVLQTLQRTSAVQSEGGSNRSLLSASHRNNALAQPHRHSEESTPRMTPRLSAVPSGILRSPARRANTHHVHAVVATDAAAVPPSDDAETPAGPDLPVRDPTAAVAAAAAVAVAVPGGLQTNFEDLRRVVRLRSQGGRRVRIERPASDAVSASGASDSDSVLHTDSTHSKQMRHAVVRGLRQPSGLGASLVRYGVRRAIKSRLEMACAYTCMVIV